MKIKIFITTYKNRKKLFENINSLLRSDLIKYNYQINIINNCGTIGKGNMQNELNTSNRNIEIYNNVLRPDFSTGHLSRNWNQAIINGFKDIKKADCDLLICTQDDVLFKTDWVKNIISLHKKYSFISFGAGDAFHSYKPSAIDRVGLWDERFCGIGYQEADYFLRQFLHNKEYSSINDGHHGRLHNPEVNIPIREDQLPGATRKDKSHMESMQFHWISKELFLKKWNLNPESWDKKAIEQMPKKPLIKDYIIYPYFELKLDYFRDMSKTMLL
ncbi:MAG: glycosyltransferase family 2 protein [Candidatus Omnitrophica bacterium]|nr:glycosyltransferase family 2 protein [Candidatus Omnitrophota bacterium]